MTLLKWLGWTLTAIGEVSGVLPAVKAFLGGVSPRAAAAVGTAGDVLTKIVGVVQQVEVVFASFTSAEAKSGAEKLQAAIPGVQALLRDYVQSGALGSATIQDKALFLKACAEIAGGTADLLNALEAPAPGPSVAQVQAGQQALRSTASAVTDAR